MGSKTKIIVLHMKEIIYTVIFIIFAVLIIGLFIAMFSGGEDKTTAASSYTPGVYSSSVMLGETPITVEVAVDSSSILSVRISNFDATMNALYPLLQSTIEDLSTQICLKQSTANLSISEDTSQTASILLHAIDSSLKKAAVH